MAFYPPIIYRYIVREICVPFAVSLFVFTGILFLARSLKLVDLVINKNVPVDDILLLFSYVIPRFLEIALPMSLLLGVIIAFGRLSSDSELVVIRATGISLKQLTVPVLLFAVFSLLFGICLTFWIRPWATHQLGLGMFEIAKTQASAGLSSGTFNDLGHLTIYAEEVEQQGGKLSKVIIGDRRNPETSRTFIARYGKIVSDQVRRTLSLKLYDGSIPEGSGENFNVTYFEVNNISLPHSELLEEQPSRSGKNSGEMYIRELIAAIHAMDQITSPLSKDEKKRKAKYKVEFQKRLAIPFSCLCVALIAMALGIQPSRGGATWGPSVSVGAGIMLTLCYYLLFALFNALARQSIMPAWIAMWIPNALFGALGLYLFNRMGSEQWLAVSQAFGEKLSKILNALTMNREAKSEGSA